MSSSSSTVVAESLQHLKRALRATLRARLRSVSPTLISAESEQVQDRILSSDLYRKSKFVAVYIPMPGELLTHHILNDLLRPDSGKQCFVPLIESSSVVTMRRVYSKEDLASFSVNRWGIPEPPLEPARDEAVECGTLDLVIVPGLGFTMKGDRIGRGKGYYDRYLTRAATELARLGKPPPRTVGVGFSVQMCESIPMSEYDCTLDQVILGGVSTQ